MKLLLLTPYLPYPPSSGGQVRSYNMLVKLAKRHELTLVCLIKNDEERPSAKHLEQYCKAIYLCNRPPKPWTVQNIFKSIFGKFPFLVVRNYSKQAKSVLEDLLAKESFDLIHAETFYVLPHLPPTKIPIFLVEQTIEYRVYEHFVHTLNKLFQPFFALDILKLKYWEKKYWQKATLVSAVSEEDALVMRNDIPDLVVKVIPTAAGEDLANLWHESKKENEPTLLLLCNFLWLQNTEAAQTLTREIFPKVKSAFPNVKCLIAGQFATAKLGKTSQAGVEIRDIKPSNVDGVLDAVRESHIMVAPLEGPGGSRLKILGAMASGVPVVTSTTGNAGINGVNNEEILIANDTSGYVAAISHLLSDKSFYDSIRKNARSLYEKKYSWDLVISILENTYKEMAQNKSK